MGTYTKISQNTFNELQLDAGILLSSFNPASPVVTDSDIICATTGGINVSAVPTFSDFGEDVDNCPVNTKELKHLDSWECTMGFTALNVTTNMIKMALGAATTTSGTHKTVPNKDLSQSDFETVWWVGDRVDGGFVAVKMINALSTGGFVLQTTKNGKGQLSVTLTGHVSISSQSAMPMEFYVIEGSNVSYTSASLTSAGFKYGVQYYTRTGSGTTQSPYVYTEVDGNATYNSGTTYYTKTVS